MYSVYTINHRTQTQYERGLYATRAKAEYMALEEVLHAASHVESGVLDGEGDVLTRSYPPNILDFHNSHQNSWGKGSQDPFLVTAGGGACHGGSGTLNSFPPGISPTSSRFIDGLGASGGTIPVSSCAFSTHETGCPGERGNVRVSEQDLREFIEASRSRRGPGDQRD